MGTGHSKSSNKKIIIIIIKVILGIDNSRERKFKNNSRVTLDDVGLHGVV